MDKPNIKPSNPRFSSGPTSKHPGWSLSSLENALLGRSHRSVECIERLNHVCQLSKKILGLPDDYEIGILPGSDTGALEAAMWCLLGNRGVDVMAWENFGKDWVIDIVDELKIKDCNLHVSEEYGNLPNLELVNFNNDVVFTWNGTTSGVKVPSGEWIPADRKGLTICDATSAIFAMPIDYSKCDVLTWSWQKVLGGEAAHGMIVLSPRAVERLSTHQPPWPVPKAFRMAKDKQFIDGIFAGNIINTPSMLCVEDAIATLNWVEAIGGLDELHNRSNKSLEIIANWIDKTDWVSFMNPNPHTRSNTGITFKITADWFTKLDEASQRKNMAEICNLLQDEKVAYDINGFPKAPPSFRVWGGCTVEPSDIEQLLPWLDWAYNKVAN